MIRQETVVQFHFVLWDTKSGVAKNRSNEWLAARKSSVNVNGKTIGENPSAE